MIDLADLDVMQRRKLFDELAYEFSATGRKAAGKSTSGDFTAVELDIWLALNEAVGVRGGGQGLKRFVDSFGRSRYAEAVDEILLFLKAGCPEGHAASRPVVAAMAKLVLQCLKVALEGRNIPASPATILRSLSSLSHAVGMAYPGYHGAKLLHRLAPIAA